MKSQSEFKQENKNLRSLLDTNRLINSPMPLHKLLSVIMKVSKKVMRADAATLMLIDEATKELVYEVALGDKGQKIKKMFRLQIGQGVAGWVAQHGKSALIEDATKDARFFSKVDKKSGFKTKSMVCVPLIVDEKVIGILQALNPLRKNFFDEDDLELFEDFASQVSVAVAKAKWQEKRLQDQKLQQDLDVARDIQKNLLSKDSITLDGLRFSARYKPANTVGGDFYDCVVLDPNKAVVILGDVSGKGVSAALYMVKAITEFRNLVGRYYPDMKLVAAALNKVLNEHSTFGMFVTAAILAIDAENKELTLINAGHLPPLVYQPKKGNVVALDKGGEPPLGILKGINYTSLKIDLEKGTQILLYSDGLTEARNGRKAEFGISRLKKCFRQGAETLPHSRLTPFVMDKIADFSEGEDRDDQTSVLIGIL